MVKRIKIRKMRIKEENIWKPDYKNKFINFLISQGILEHFEISIGIFSLDEYLESRQPLGYMLGGFDWNHSDLGFDFWQKIHNKWENIINQIK